MIYNIINIYYAVDIHSLLIVIGNFMKEDFQSFHRKLLDFPHFQLNRGQHLLYRLF